MTALITAALFDELETAVGVDVGGRIHPIHLPPNSPVPAVAYRLMHVGQRNNMSGGTTMYQVRYQVDLIHPTFEGGIEVQAKIINHFRLLTLPGIPSVAYTEVDYSTWFEEVDIQLYRFTTGISIFSNSI